MDPILQPHLGREPSQQYQLAVLSQQDPTLSIDLKAQTVTSPRTDPESKPHMPKGVTSKHV